MPEQPARWSLPALFTTANRLVLVQLTVTCLAEVCAAAWLPELAAAAMPVPARASVRAAPEAMMAGLNLRNMDMVPSRFRRHQQKPAELQSFHFRSLKPR